jgi:signal transduction histidine kinase
VGGWICHDQGVNSSAQHAPHQHMEHHANEHAERPTDPTFDPTFDRTGTHDHGSHTSERPPLLRDVRSSASGVGGVSRGLAQWLGVEPTTVRFAFAISALFNGIGLLVYALLWSILPDTNGSVPARKLGIRVGTQHQDPVLAGAFGMVLTGALLLVRQTGLWFPTSYIWPLVAMAVGLGVVWQPRRASRGTRFASGRLAAGAILVAVGFVSLFGRGRSFTASRQMILDTIVVLAGIALLVGPLVTRLIRALRVEEQRRATSEAKADVAAHLHDSVLQTLALIQKRAEAPTEVVTLARRQERELREWLYGNPRQPDSSLKAALEQAASDLESDHGIPIDIVVVGGDVTIDQRNAERITGLVAAAREAMANGARHSGSPKVFVYVEVSADVVDIFVRDTGIGFDRSDVEATRRGVSESIEGRMQRIGGTATIKSTKHVGTNVELRLPRLPEEPS